MSKRLSPRAAGLSRRDLLRAGLSGVALSTGMPLFFDRLSGALAAEATAGADARRERILVVVELSGGNDGLNTVVPYGDDAYYRARPTIGLKAEDLRPIDDHFAFHRSLKGFDRLYKAGRMAVVHGCGYDQPTESHFAAMSYWHTGVPNGGGETLGWVGRLADGMQPTPRENYIVNVATQQSLAVRGKVHTPLVFSDPESFRRIATYEEKPVLDDLTGRHGTGNDTLDFLSGVADSAQKSAAFVRDAWARYKSPVEYGIDIGFARDLKKVVAMIDAGMPTRLYYTSFAGNAFDTHVHQVDTHARLLAYAGDAIRGFQEDIERIGRGDDVAMVVFTEFGRRVAENASGGTDHGTATPMFVVGKGVTGGLYGEPPSLTELAQGNLIKTTDYRRVYATMIDEWLGYQDTAAVLKGEFEPMGIFA